MTTIEWTHVPDGKGARKKGETVNPQVGCSETSPGCRNCYAARVAARGMTEHHRGLTVLRSNGPHWNGKIARAPAQLEKPLQWRAPRGIFWGSMTDLFHESTMATEDGRRYIAACLGVMAATPQHTHMVLTKRPHLMREWFEWLKTADLGVTAIAAEQSACNVIAAARTLFWPKHVEDDDRLWRMVCKAPADLWPLPNIWVGTTAEDQQRADERLPIMELLREDGSIDKAFVSYEPALGSIDFDRWLAPVDHCGNCGAEHGPRDDDQCPECGLDNVLVRTWGERQAQQRRRGQLSDTDRDGPPIDWLICGGESGPGARPMHPDWARSARDQAQAAGVPFLFKQWGAWAPSSDDWTHVVFDDGEIKNRATVRKVGKSKSGRELDGRTWDEFPVIGDQQP